MTIGDKNILVTGGNGFLGINLIKRFINSDVEKIRVVDNLERSSLNRLLIENKNVEFIKCDLSDNKVVDKICKDIDIVFHCASKVGSISYYADNPSLVYNHNVNIDLNMINAAKNSHVMCFVYMSSAFIYPFSRMQDPYGIPIKETESIPANPLNAYGWAKLCGEKALDYAVKQSEDLKGVIFRLSNFFGPDQNTDLKRGSIIPVLIRKIIEYPSMKPLKVYGDGYETRTYCHVKDIIDALLVAIDKTKEKKIIGPLNIGSEEVISIKELTGKIISISGKEIEIERVKSPAPLLKSMTLNCNRARKELDGWKPKITLQEGLEKMYKLLSVERPWI